MTKYNTDSFVEFRVSCPFSHDADGRHSVRIYTKKTEDSPEHYRMFSHVETQCFKYSGKSFKLFDSSGCAKAYKDIIDFARRSKKPTTADLYTPWKYWLYTVIISPPEKKPPRLLPARIYHSRLLANFRNQVATASIGHLNSGSLPRRLFVDTRDIFTDEFSGLLHVENSYSESTELGKARVVDPSTGHTFCTTCWNNYSSSDENKVHNFGTSNHIYSVKHKNTMHAKICNIRKALTNSTLINQVTANQVTAAESAAFIFSLTKTQFTNFVKFYQENERAYRYSYFMEPLTWRINGKRRSTYEKTHK